MKRKLILVLGLIFLLSVVLCACGGKTDPTSSLSESETTTTEESTTEEPTTYPTPLNTPEAPSSSADDETPFYDTEDPEETTTGYYFVDIDDEEVEKMEDLSAYYPDVFVVTADSLNVREQPSTDSAVIGGISKNGGGTVLEVVDENWLKIRSGIVEGYVAKTYTLTGEEGYEAALALLKKRIMITEEVANVRSGPSMQDSVIGAAYEGSVFDIVQDREEGSSFYRIRYGETTNAWVHYTVVRPGWYLNCAVKVAPKTDEGTEASSEGGNASEGGNTETQAPTTAENVTPAPSTPGMPARVTNGTNGYIVCIDAGHQQTAISATEPNGPGSSEMKAKLSSGTYGRTTGVPEYETNLQVALKLEQVLLNRGYTVVMLRVNNDCPYSNAERAQVANNYGAHAFVRLHCNGNDNASIAGIVNYAPSTGNPYLTQDNITKSRNLANQLLNHMVAATGAQNRGVINGDNMTGINWSQVPVTLVEMGFMTNPDEDVKLNDPNYQNLLAEGMANGIDAFLGR